MKYCVTINNKRYEVEVEKGNAAILKTMEIAPKAMENEISALKQTPEVEAVPSIAIASDKTTEASEAMGKEIVKAPMAGAIIDIKVSVGSSVKAGDTLLLLEAMKMENEISAHGDGVVAQIKVKKGDFVAADDVLIVLK